MLPECKRNVNRTSRDLTSTITHISHVIRSPKSAKLLSNMLDTIVIKELNEILATQPNLNSPVVQSTSKSQLLQP